MDILRKYFTNLTKEQYEKLDALVDHYIEWNAKINVISRKDIENITEHHILHSLSLQKIIRFQPGTNLLDVGTGGGFPGVPLAIVFPSSKFHLIDSIGKKIKVVTEITNALDITNVRPEHKRVQQVMAKYDFVISRAVTAFPSFVNMTRKNISDEQRNGLPNGILYLKGGDFSSELKHYKEQVAIFKLSDYFEEEFFETKKVVYLPI